MISFVLHNLSGTCAKLRIITGENITSVQLWWGSCHWVYVGICDLRNSERLGSTSTLISQLLSTVKMGLASVAFLFTALTHLLSGVNAAQLKQKPLAEYISYTSVPGYFLQDNNATNASTFNFVRCPRVSKASSTFN
jgi:hypothetical protein